MRRGGLIFLVLMLFPISGFCGEGFSFKGIRTGDDYESLATKFGKCTGGKNPFYTTDECLVGKDTIAGVPATILLEFYGGKLAWISVHFNSDDFSTIFSALRSKYGNGKIKENFLQNRMGATFKNIIVTWENQKDEMSLEKYAGDFNSSKFKIMSHSAKKEFERRFNEDRKKKIKDL